MHALVSGGEAQEAAPDDPAERLWAAVRTLPDKQREAVLLVYGEGLSHAAAADAMSCAEATVSWHIHEAKKRAEAHDALGRGRVTMANDEFDLLRNGPVATPRAEARERALDAALNAYDLRNTSAAHPRKGKRQSSH